MKKMKKSLIAGIIALACITANNTDLNAQRTNTSTNTMSKVDSENTKVKGEKHKALSEKMIKELDLSKKQAQQVRVINEDAAQEVKTIRESKMPENLKREKLKALKKSQNEKVSAILKKDQQAKYDDFLARMKENRQEIRKEKGKNRQNSNASNRKGRVDSINGAERGNANSRTAQGQREQKAQNPEAMAISRTARMKSNLGLDARQEAAVLAINKRSAVEMQALHNDKENISRQEQMVRKGQIETNTNNAILDVLNPQQQEKFNAYVAKREQQKMNRGNGKERGNSQEDIKPMPR